MPCLPRPLIPSPEADGGREGRSDEGSALVEFVLVSILVIALAMGVTQLALTLHVRNLMVSAASEGARLAATNDRGPQDGVERTEWLLGESLGGVEAQATAEDTTIDGAPAVEVSVVAPVPILGLWGAGTMSVSARAFEEASRG
ncbi:MAG: pilus assembly protein [Demequinaceae bacterium]|nr:pilus assembly protein [Demequinaceae bacterium]